MYVSIARFLVSAVFVATIGIVNDSTSLSAARAPGSVHGGASATTGAVTSGNGKVSVQVTGEITVGTLPSNNRVGAYNKTTLEIDVIVDPAPQGRKAEE